MSSAVILKDLEEKAKALFTLYNPSIKEESFLYGGDAYRLPPRSSVPIGNKNGTKDGLAIVVHNAIDVVRHALKDNVLGMKGVTALFGDAKDKERIAAANKTYMEWRFRDANAQYANHMKRSKAYAEANPGARALIPDRSTQEAIEFIALYKRGDYEVRKAYPCTAQYCGIAYDTEDELRTHMALLHSAGEPAPETVVDDKGEDEGDPFTR